MKPWQAVFEIFPLEHDEAGLVGWHVIGIVDRVNYNDPDTMPYGYKMYIHAVQRAGLLTYRLDKQVDEIILK